MRKLMFSLASVGLIVALAGCSSGPSGDGRECVDVPADVMQSIADGANGTPITPLEAGAVRSESFDDVNIVTMSFDVDGETETASWAVGGSLEDPGPILSVDAVAAVVTDWPNEIKGEQLKVTEDGVEESADCLAASE